MTVRLAVLGASGQTGRWVVAGALARGWPVRAISRHATAALAAAPGLRCADLDLLTTSADRLEHALEGCDAVVSTLGLGTSREPTTLYSTAIDRTVRALPQVRVAVVSAVPVGGVEGHAVLERRVAIPVLRRLFAETYADMARMERRLAASEAAWTVLRSPRLRDGDATGALACRPEPIRGGRSVTTGDLALALLDAVEPDAAAGRLLYVASMA